MRWPIRRRSRSSASSSPRTSTRRASLAETERLRSALLTSISHDLRTPLASILGAATSLRELRRALRRGERDELLATIQDEAERLNRFVANLLDMTRLESGALEPSAGADRPRRGRRHARCERAGKVLAAPPRRRSISPPTCRCCGSISCCSSRCCSICSTTPRNTRRPAPRSTSRRRRQDDSVVIEMLDEGGGIPPERSRAHLRQVLPRPPRRPAARRHRARPRDLPRLRRGDGRHASRQPIAATAAGAVFTISLPMPQPAHRMEAA